VEGIGEDIFPSTMDFGVLDDIFQVTDGECFVWARKLARLEGIFAGGSAGGAVSVALQVARTSHNSQANSARSLTSLRADGCHRRAATWTALNFRLAIAPERVAVVGCREVGAACLAAADYPVEVVGRGVNGVITAEIIWLGNEQGTYAFEATRG